MRHVLDRAIDVRRELVAGRELRCQPHGELIEALIVDSGAAVRIKAVGNDVGVRDVAIGSKQPQLVPLDRPAHRHVRVVHVFGSIALPEPLLLKLRREVVALKRAARVPGEARATEGIAAFARDQVDMDARRGHFSARRAGLHRDFLRHRIVVVRLRLAAEVHRIHLHAVDVNGVVGCRHPVQQQPLLRRSSRSADRLSVGLHANRKRAQLGIRPARRNRIHQLALQDRRVLRALDVDDGRAAGDGDRLFERSNLQFHVDRRGEVGRQVDAVADQRGEAGERERHFVEAGPEIAYRVASLLVGDRFAGPLDERRARRLHRNARQNAAAGVSDQSRDGALGEGR